MSIEHFTLIMPLNGDPVRYPLQNGETAKLIAVKIEAVEIHPSGQIYFPGIAVEDTIILKLAPFDETDNSVAGLILQLLATVGVRPALKQP